MSKPTRKQLCELFSQIAEGKITGKMIQKLIENPSRAKIFKNVLQARKTADGITDPYKRSRALRDIVETLAEVEELEQAREVATLIADHNCRVDALEIIARFSHRSDDIEEASRAKHQVLLDIAKKALKTENVDNPNGGTDLWR